MSFQAPNPTFFEVPLPFGIGDVLPLDVRRNRVLYKNMKSPEIIKREAGEKLRAEIRQSAKDHGIASQAEMAALLGITPQYLCDMMGGRRKLGPDRLKLLGSRLGLSRQGIVEWHRLGATAEGWLLA